MLYEALTGQVPFEAETPVAVALKQISEPPRPPSRAQPADPAGARRGRPAGARQGPGGPLPERRRVPPGARRGRGRPGGRARRGRGGRGHRSRRSAALVAPAVGDRARRDRAARSPGWPPSRSRAPPRPTCPLVLGDTVGEARAKIEGAGFDFAQGTAPTCSPQDTVTEQDPPARSTADEGSTVTVTVSLGLGSRCPTSSGWPSRTRSPGSRTRTCSRSPGRRRRDRQGGARDLHRPRRPGPRRSASRRSRSRSPRAPTRSRCPTSWATSRRSAEAELRS